MCFNSISAEYLLTSSVASSSLVQLLFPRLPSTTTTTTTSCQVTITARWAAITSTLTRLLSPWLLTAMRLTSESTWTITSPQAVPTAVATTTTAITATPAMAMPTPIAPMTRIPTVSVPSPLETTPSSTTTLSTTPAVLLHQCLPATPTQQVVILMRMYPHNSPPATTIGGTK